MSAADNDTRENHLPVAPNRGLFPPSIVRGLLTQNSKMAPTPARVTAPANASAPAPGATSLMAVIVARAA